MSLVNATYFSVLDVPYVDPKGQRVVIAIVKATFELDRAGALVPAAEPSPVRVDDVLWDEQRPNGSVRYPTDIGCAKRGADVVVVGSAVSPKPVTRMDVTVRIGAHEAPIVVHGDRVFYKGAGGVIIGPAGRFETMPVVYERASGGMAPDFRLADERNPSGVGVAHRVDDLVGQPAPQIEHPKRPHTRAGQDHPPVGYGATRPHWLPRRTFAGTFDEVWQRTRMPLLPLDYDARFENVAHPSLQLEAALAPGTPIAVLGMSEATAFRCEVPDLRLVVHGLRNGEKATLRPLADTLVIEPARARIELTSRAVFTMGRGRTSLREIRVDTDV